MSGAAFTIVAAQLVFKTGSDANPLDKPGLANFTSAMLDEGTSTRNALQIADELARLGGSLSTGSTMDATTVNIRSLSSTFPAMLNLMADVVLRPSFPAEEIERQRESHRAAVTGAGQPSAGRRAGDVARALRGRSIHTATARSAPKRRSRRCPART